MSSVFHQLDNQFYMSLKTFRKNGEAVLTPVWFAQVGDHLYMATPPKSGKAKRIRHTPQVEIASCTQEGDLIGEFEPAQARFLSADELDIPFKAMEAKYDDTETWQEIIQGRVDGSWVFLEISSR